MTDDSPQQEQPAKRLPPTATIPFPAAKNTTQRTSAQQPKRPVEDAVARSEYRLPEPPKPGWLVLVLAVPAVLAIFAVLALALWWLRE